MCIKSVFNSVTQKTNVMRKRPQGLYKEMLYLHSVSYFFCMTAAHLLADILSEGPTEYSDTSQDITEVTICNIHQQFQQS